MTPAIREKISLEQLEYLILGGYGRPHSDQSKNKSKK